MKTQIQIQKDWITNFDERYFQSLRLLKYGFKHAFFAKRRKDQGPESLVKLISKKSSIHIAKQIHGNNILEAYKAINKPWPCADGIISTNNSQSLWVYTADCIPILFADKRTGQVAAVHAGWKGLSLKILKKTLSKLQLLGSNLEDLIVILGPSISQNKYQVNQELVLGVFNTIESKKDLRKDFKQPINKMINLGIVKEDIIKGKFLLDIRLLALTQLKKEGLSANQIDINKTCTFSNKDFFYSYRRDKEKNIQWSCIVSNERI